MFIVFNDHKIVKVTFDDFKFSPSRRIEICLTRLKDCCIMLATTFTPCFAGMDVTHDVATDQSSDDEALICNGF